MDSPNRRRQNACALIHSLREQRSHLRQRVRGRLAKYDPQVIAIEGGFNVRISEDAMRDLLEIDALERRISAISARELSARNALLAHRKPVVARH